MLRSVRSDRAAGVARAASASQAAGDARRHRRDKRTDAVTNGARNVTNGEATKAFWTGAAIIVPITAAVGVVNALTVIADRPDFALWEPWSWEATSALVILFLIWIPWLALMRAPPGAASWPRVVITHGAALLIFSTLHVAGFVLFREAVYVAQGGDYDFGNIAERFPYELRKDALSYLALTATFWIAFKLRESPPADQASPTFDIRDGARIIRIRGEEIIAVTAAGNYAEFILSDGRRPLMRMTLAKLEAELAPLGLIRTHRSWLVNPAHLTGLEPDGSGDWTVELGTVKAPLSRRYPAALDRMRG